MEAVELLGQRQKKFTKWTRLGKNGEILASIGVLHPPWTSADVRDVCGRKMGAVELLWGKTENTYKEESRVEW